MDYENFLRQRGLGVWSPKDPRRAALISRRCQTADEVAEWVRAVHDERHGQSGRDGRNGPNGQKGTSTTSTQSTTSTYPEIAANAALVLIAVACSLLDRQIAAQSRAFEQEGGFTERLYRVRTARRKK